MDLHLRRLPLTVMQPKMNRYGKGCLVADAKRNMAEDERRRISDDHHFELVFVSSWI